MGGHIKLDRPIKIEAGGKPIHLSQISSLHKALRHLSLHVSRYHYSVNAMAHLLLIAKVADDYYIICNTKVDNAIYVQSKDDGKYLRFQRDPKFNLYYMDISEANVEEHMIDWARQELHLDLTRCAADLHVPCVKDAIRFVKERLRSIQCFSRGDSLLKC